MTEFATEGAAVSRLEAALMRRASRQGLTAKELIEQDRNAELRPDYPSPECLNPHEVEQFFAGRLSPDRSTHLDQCPMCSAIIEVSQPTQKAFAAVWADVQHVAPAAALVKAPKTRALALAGELCAAAVLPSIVVGALTWWLFRGTAVTLAIDATIPQLAALVGCTAAAGVCIAALNTRFGSKRLLPIVRGELVAALLVGLTALYFGAYSVKTTSEGIAGAQDALLSAIAHREAAENKHMRHEELAHVVVPINSGYKINAVNNGKTIEAVVKSASGKMIAYSEDDNFSMVWKFDDGALTGKEKPLGTIYTGVLQKSGDGDSHIVTPTGKLEISSKSTNFFIKDGASVVALVPHDYAEAMVVKEVK